MNRSQIHDYVQRVSRDQRLLARVLTVGRHDASLEAEVNWCGTTTVVEAALRTHLAGEFLEAASRMGLRLSRQDCERLEAQRLQTATATLNGRRAFGPIASYLNACDVPFLLLKGSALTMSVYKRPDRRPMTDIDLLVRPDDVPRVDEVLRSAGCSCGRALIREDFFPRYYYEREYNTGGPAVCRLDVHAHPFRPLRYLRTVPPGAFWDCPRWGELDGVPVYYPSHENMLLHLAVHSAIHGDARFLWLYDIVRFVGSRGRCLDWGLIQDRAAAWSLSEAAGRTLARAAELFENRELQRRCRSFSGGSGWRDRVVLAHAPQDATRPVRHVMINLLTTPGLRYRAGYLSAVFRPARAHLESVYRRRHRGWVACAHGWRALRPLYRSARAFLSGRRPLLGYERVACNGQGADSGG